MKTIPISRGFAVQVDDADYEKATRYRYSACPSWYNQKRVYPIRSKQGRTKMMVEDLFPAPVGQVHAYHDRNPLNLTRANVLICSVGVLRTMQGHKRRFGAIPYRGVYLYRSKFRAGITKNSRLVWLGVYDRPEEAAVAYDREATQLYGRLARLNFPANDKLALRGAA